MNLDFVRSCCLSRPGATEDIKWGNNLVFSVGGKMFCIADLDPPFTCSFKVAEEDFESLSMADGFQPAPYMARAKWVLVTRPELLHRQEWERYLEASYELVKAKLPKKTRQELENTG